MNFSSFHDIEPNFTEINMSGQPVLSFDGIQKFQNLQKLNISNTLVTTFKHATTLPNLTEIDFRNTPLSKYPFVREMCLFAFGFSIRLINGKEVTDEERNLSNYKYRPEAEATVRNGEYIRLNYSGRFTKCFGKCSYETSKYIEKRETKATEGETSNNSTNQLLENIAKTTSQVHQIRMENRNQNKCFILPTLAKYDEFSVDSLKDELNQIKPPIEYQRDQIRLEAQQKKDAVTIDSLHSILNDLNTKLNKNEFSLLTANETNSRLQEELKKLMPNNQIVDDYLEKLNELRDEKTTTGQLETEFESLTSLHSQISQNAKKAATAPQQLDLSLESDLNKILQAAEALKNEKLDAEAKLNALRNRIESQKDEIMKLRREEENKRKQKEELLESIKKKQKEKDEALKIQKELQNQASIQKKVLAAEFVKMSEKVQQEAETGSDLVIEEMTKIPSVE
ncbi:hypothetical protein TRFO_08416 [Tritrichomonas foetus]|uniref:Leucine Rich Repeat family protein n=1 Tax=Tritrichomonas foetus TaxID=1144522 RepID=A0A1J4JQF6_9EUKA|nr:hypothetical protein TRFO_08416 [Tritrichomonas foetus]|eukprot:OHS99468.1 hypothetical protein TRFO_08416 [Tritrichomonas foetus]